MTEISSGNIMLMNTSLFNHVGDDKYGVKPKLMFRRTLYPLLFPIEYATLMFREGQWTIHWDDWLIQKSTHRTKHTVALCYAFKWDRMSDDDDLNFRFEEWKIFDE